MKIPKKFLQNSRTGWATAGVLALILVSWMWGDKFIALAGELIDNFSTTDRVADTWQVEVNTGLGEIRLSERSCDSDEWICAQADVCINHAGDGEYILVASTTVGSRQWKTSNTNCDLPHCLQDGGQDGDIMSSDNTVSFTNYPARQACKEAGGRLPTVAELQCIYTNRSVFNDTFGSSYFWSATETSETHARTVLFSTGAAFNSTKTYDTGSVRCVRGW